MGGSLLVLSVGNAIGDNVSFFGVRAASGDSPLITGLTGVGKVVVAHSLGNARSETLMVDGCDKLSSDIGGMIAAEEV